ncbi:hypothetical protein KCU69_g18338, partial [Aureobasidium melanogenum]
MSLSLYLREPNRSFRSRRRDPLAIALTQLAESVSAVSARPLRIGLTHDVPTALDNHPRPPSRSSPQSRCAVYKLDRYLSFRPLQELKRDKKKKKKKKKK